MSGVATGEVGTEVVGEAVLDHGMLRLLIFWAIDLVDQMMVTLS